MGEKRRGSRGEGQEDWVTQGKVREAEGKKSARLEKRRKIMDQMRKEEKAK